MGQQTLASSTIRFGTKLKTRREASKVAAGDYSDTREGLD